MLAAPQVAVFYLIMDTLIDSFFPVLSDFDDSIDDLEGAILKNPTEEQLGTLFDMKRQIMTIRKVITPQRDMISSLNAGMVSIPGMTDQGAAYFRNLYDHLIRISDMVDGYRDLIGGAMDTHLSMVSNRLNVVMKQLAIIATIFLPLGFLTGFFGQNFAWPIAHLQVGLRLLPLPRHRLRAGRDRAPAHPLQAARLARQRPHGLTGSAGSSFSRRPSRATCLRRLGATLGDELLPGEQPGHLAPVEVATKWSSSISTSGRTSSWVRRYVSVRSRPAARSLSVSAAWARRPLRARMPASGCRLLLE